MVCCESPTVGSCVGRGVNVTDDGIYSVCVVPASGSGTSGTAVVDAAVHLKCAAVGCGKSF